MHGHGERNNIAEQDVRVVRVVITHRGAECASGSGGASHLLAVWPHWVGKGDPGNEKALSPVAQH